MKLKKIVHVEAKNPKIAVKVRSDAKTETEITTETKTEEEKAEVKITPVTAETPKIPETAWTPKPDENSEIQPKSETPDTASKTTEPTKPAPTVRNIQKTETKNIINNNTNTNNIKPTTVIERYFDNIGYIITRSRTPEKISGLRKLTEYIGTNFEYVENLLNRMRGAIAGKEFGLRNFNMNLSHDDYTQNREKELLELFAKYGVMHELKVGLKNARGQIVSIPRTLAYINGYWLELYSNLILQDIVAQFAAERGVDCEIRMNVVVASKKTPDKIAHEFDSIFSIGNITFAFEAKSGKTFEDYLKLYKIIKEDMGFVPERYLLLAANITDSEVADTLHYFYEYYICGMSDFKEKINEMLDEAFNIG